MVDHVAGRHSESDLRGNEPDPINSGIQRRINQPQGGPDERRPQERGYETSPESRAPRRQHRQQYSKEQTDENREHTVADQTHDKTSAVESGQLRKIGSSQGGHGSCGQEVNRIPDAAVRNDTVQTRYN